MAFIYSHFDWNQVCFKVKGTSEKSQQKNHVELAM